VELKNRRVVTAAQFRSELFEIKAEHARLTEKLREREKDASEELLNFWNSQVALINKTKPAIEKAIHAKKETELEELLAEVHNVIGHISEINTKIIAELTCENLTQLQVKELCTQLTNSSSSSLMILADFLTEIIDALVADETEYIQQLLAGFKENDSEVEDE